MVKENLGKKVSSITKDWILSSTSHGLPNVFRNENKVLKVLWILFFIGSVVACAYTVYTNVVAYLDFVAVTKVSVIYENPITFPTVTFCNANAFVTPEGLNFVNKSITTMGLNSVDSPQMKMLVDYPSAQITTNIYYLNVLAKQLAVNQNDTEKKKFGFTLNDLMIGCVFASFPCNSTLIKWYYHSDYGNCFKFNSQLFDPSKSAISLQKTSLTGERFGLSLFLFVGVPNNSLTLSISSGAVIMVHDQNAAASSSMSITAEAGTQARVAISRQTQTQLPAPFSDCLEKLDSPNDYDSEIYRKTLLLNYTYNQEDCIALNQYYQIQKVCNCSVGFSEVLGGKPCKELKDVMCSFNVYTSTAPGSSQDLALGCPLECKKESYSSSVTSLSLITDSYGHWLMQDQSIIDRLQKVGLTPSLENIKRNVVGVNIYYEQTKYTSITESPAQGFYDFLGSIGGTMGLWIGISFLSFVEIAELLVQISLILVKHYGKRKTRQITEEVPRAESPVIQISHGLELEEPYL